MNPTDLDSDPQTNVLAWLQPDPVTILTLCLTLVAFTRPDPGPDLGADGPSWPHPVPREVPDVQGWGCPGAAGCPTAGRGMGRALAGDAWPCQPRKPAAAPGSLGCHGAAGPCCPDNRQNHLITFLKSPPRESDPW